MDDFKPIVGLKIGGSIATEKNARDFPLCFREIKERAFNYIKVENIRRIGAEEILPTLSRVNLFLGLGAGPFGHYLVKHKEKISNVMMIHRSVSYYAALVTEVLKRTGLPVIYKERFSPVYACYYENNRLHTEKLERWVRGEIDKRRIPIFHGDIIPCKDKRGSLSKFEVLSADKCLARLAIKLKAKRIIAATDEDGLYSADPKLNPSAKFIPIVRARDEVKISKFPRRADVTGEMPQKVREFQEAARAGIEALIVNGLVKGRIRKALLGEKCIATIILP